MRTYRRGTLLKSQAGGKRDGADAGNIQTSQEAGFPGRNFSAELKPELFSGSWTASVGCFHIQKRQIRCSSERRFGYGHSEKQSVGKKASSGSSEMRARTVSRSGENRQRLYRRLCAFFLPYREECKPGRQILRVSERKTGVNRHSMLMVFMMFLVSKYTVTEEYLSPLPTTSSASVPSLRTI